MIIAFIDAHECVFSLCQYLNEHSRDTRFRGARGCRIILTPFVRRICESDNEDFRLDFMYYLQMTVRVPPEVFPADNAICAGAGTTEMGQIDDHHSFKVEKRFHRKRESIVLKEGSTPSRSTSSPTQTEPSRNTSENIESGVAQKMLLRYVSLKTEPFVHNISEQELKIVVSWTNYMISTVPAALSSLDLNLSRISSTAEEVRKRLERREFLSYLDKLFRRFNVTSGEYIAPDILKAIFKMFLAPLHLLVNEERDQIRDLMFIFDRNLDGLITLEEFATVGLELFVKSGWSDHGDVSLKVRTTTAQIINCLMY